MISPRERARIAARSSKDIASLVAAIDRLTEQIGRLNPVPSPRPIPTGDLIAELPLRTLTKNALLHEGIKTVDHLAACERAELMRLPNFGHLAWRQVREALIERGVWTEETHPT
jgi:DNA-directed RNA polymerase alpha subunit